MKVKLIKKIKKNTPMEKEVDRNESKMRHARHADFDFAVCAYEDLQDDLDKEQKAEDQVAREILFKAKIKSDGKWVRGWYCRYPFDNWPLKDVIVPSVEAESRKFYRFVEVDPSTVGQFTGLYDKNGAQIFEGDILDMCILRHDHSLKAVSIEHGAAGFYPLHPEEEAEGDRRWRSFWCNDEQEVWDSKYFTVVGNIHDIAPELIRKEND